MVNFDPNVASAAVKIDAGAQNNSPKIGQPSKDFGKTVNAVSDYLSKVDDQQKSADVSIMDLLSGKNEDINSVVAAVAKADVSFKMLVGVRNKLIEAYKQTMNMPV